MINFHTFFGLVIAVFLICYFLSLSIRQILRLFYEIGYDYFR